METLISLVIPVYKVEEYLERCINSVIAQTYQNLEIILVDDGSPDKCPRICDEYAKKDNRIRVIHKNNGGLSDARNAGIDAANGMYIGFVDSDDYIHPEMYERLWKQLNEENADIVICGIERVYHAGYEVQEVAENAIKKYDGLQAIRNILDKNLHVVSVVAWGKLYKKSLFEGIRFPKGKIHEDEFTTYQLFYKSNKIVELSGRYYYYFQREDSIMGVRKKKFVYDGIEAYEQMGKFFLGHQEEEILYLVKYQYLYMLKDSCRKLKKSGREEDKKIVERLDKKFRREYKESISKIKGTKRKIRMGLYYWLGLNI